MSAISSSLAHHYICMCILNGEHASHGPCELILHMISSLSVHFNPPLTVVHVRSCLKFVELFFADIPNLVETHRLVQASRVLVESALDMFKFQTALHNLLSHVCCSEL